MLPDGAGEIVVRGSVPDARRYRGMVLTAVARGGELARWTLPPGNFEVRFTAPDPGPRGVAFELRASRWVRRWYFAEVRPRRRAYRLESIEWAHAAADPGVTGGRDDYRVSGSLSLTGDRRSRV
jgi:hypothetical protein